MSRAPIVPDLGQRCIVVDDLRLRFFIGVHEHEKQARQEVSITIHMFVAESRGPPSDDLADYASYADIVDQLKQRAASTRHVELVETLAEEVVALAFADPRVASVLIDVRKTEIIPEAKGVGVIIHRQRGSGHGAGLADAD
jgi:7,8-dihydroneopterin aldolase/epimerase/oxygenase